MSTSVRRALLVAPLAPPLVLAACAAVIGTLAQLGGHAHALFVTLFVSLQPILLFVLPLSVCTAVGFALIARVVGHELAGLPTSAVLVGTSAVMVTLGYALRAWTGNGTPWWTPFLLVPLALAQAVVFLRVRPGDVCR